MVDTPKMKELVYFCNNWLKNESLKSTEGEKIYLDLKKTPKSTFLSIFRKCLFFSMDFKLLTALFSHAACIQFRGKKILFEPSNICSFVAYLQSFRIKPEVEY